jgi:hypothetical protein
MLVTLRRSKTDQEGFGRRVAIPRGEIACPVAALRAWLDAAGITEGAIFAGSSTSGPSGSPIGAWRLGMSQRS